MRTEGLFLDTSAIVADLWIDDPCYHQAKALFARIANDEFKPLVVSEFIISEVVTAVSMRIGHEIAVATGGALRKHVDKVVPASEIFEGAWQLYASGKLFADQPWYLLSFVDCTTLVAMQTQGLRRLATFDESLIRYVEERKLGIRIAGRRPDPEGESMPAES